MFFCGKNLIKEFYGSAPIFVRQLFCIVSQLSIFIIHPILVQIFVQKRKCVFYLRNIIRIEYKSQIENYTTYSNFSYAYQNLILSDKCKVGNDGRNLVQITTIITNTKKRNWSITVYDLR
jgi:hypothetical protein